MIGYVTLGVSDMDKAKTFWGELLSELDCKVLYDGGRIAFIGQSMGSPMIAVCKPFDESDPHPGNGNMVALNPGSKEMVDKLYQKALDLGGTCEGAPGVRIEDVFYGAYFRDPDGNKACFFRFGG